MLEVEGLCKRFGGLQAVNNLSFSAGQGSITSLIGPNGAGKSTVFDIISGGFKPDSGCVKLDGKDVTGWSPQRLNSNGLCRSFQISNLMFELSTFENVRLAAQARESRRRIFSRLSLDPKSASSQAAMFILQEFGLAHLSKQPAKHLSHGDQRLLELAICMAGQPRLLLLDEPTQGLSATETQVTASLIRRLATQGLTVLLVEHDIDLVMTISDHIIVMQQGSKIAEGNPQHVRADRLVQEVYLGEVVEHRDAHA